MIDPTEADIGRTVIYHAHKQTERGVITSFNAHAVFVRYGSKLHAEAPNREDLTWEFPRDHQ